MATLHGEEHYEFKFLECLKDNFLDQLITKPTRYRLNQRSNILDLLLTNNSEIIQEVSLINNIGASDHIPLFINCQPQYEESETLKLNFNKADNVKIKTELESIDWTCLEKLNVQDILDFFQTVIEKCIDLYVPIKKGKSKHRSMTNDCFRVIKKKHKAWRKYTCYKTLNNYQNYCQARNLCTKTLRSANRKFERNLAAYTKTNSKT